MPVPLEQVLTHLGSIAMTMNEPVLMLSVLIWCIARGSDVVSGELGRGTLEMLLSHPISRRKLLITHSMMATLGLAVLCFVVWFGFFIGIKSNSVKETIATTAEVKIPFLPLQIPVTVGPSEDVITPLSEKVDPGLLVLPCMNLFAFGFVVLSLSTFCSSLDRFRWRAIGISLGIYVVQVLVFVLSKATDATAVFAKATFLTLYKPDAIAQVAHKFPKEAWTFFASEEVAQSHWDIALGPIGVSTTLIAIGVALHVASVIAFERRDIAAPL